MKEAGIEITFRQSFFSDPAVPVKNLKVGWSEWWAQPRKGLGKGLPAGWRAWAGADCVAGKQWHLAGEGERCLLVDVYPPLLSVTLH